MAVRTSGWREWQPTGKAHKSSSAIQAKASARFFVGVEVRAARADRKN
jgi:hypothetical protein